MISSCSCYLDLEYLPNPTAMKDQYLRANHFVNGLNGMLDRGPSG